MKAEVVSVTFHPANNHDRVEVSYRLLDDKGNWVATGRRLATVPKEADAFVQAVAAALNEDAKALADDMKDRHPQALAHALGLLAQARHETHLAQLHAASIKHPRSKQAKP